MSLQNIFHTKIPTNLPSPLANAHKQSAGGMVGVCETPTTHLPSFNITYLPSATNQKYKHGRCMVGVCPTPTIPQSPYPSAFQRGDGRLVGIFARKLFFCTSSKIMESHFLFISHIIATKTKNFSRFAWRFPHLFVTLHS